MESSYVESGHFMEPYDDDDDADHTYSFSDSSKLNSTTDLLECAFCVEVFTNVKRLRAHKKDHYKNKTFSCKLCPAHFTSYLGWLFHFRKHRSDLQYSCDICGAKYCSFQQLVRHTEGHEYHKETKFICNLCYKAFSLQYELLTHEREVHNVTDNYGNESRILNVYSCAKCYQAFRKVKQYRNHLKRSLSCRPYSCQNCGKGFLSKLQFQSHSSNYLNCREMSEKLLRKKFAAKIPNIKIPRVETTLRFNRAVTGDERNRVDERKSYICNKCDRVFHKVHHRRDHWIRHENCRPYWCNDCDAKFVSKDRLETHVRIHSYKCQTCLRIFMLKNEFDHHCCKNLSRTSYESEYLANKNVTRKMGSWPDSKNTNEKNFKFVCQYCCQTYLTENELQEHIDYVSLHLFICSKCSQTFIFRNKCTYGYHMSTVHGIEK